ncbi:MAG: pyridoxamine 5'-phosphate oxidase family protein [Pseudonocardiaceae bacterium]
MRQQDVARVFNDPLAQQLLHSPIPARLAYTATDGSPRVVPVGYYWNGADIVIGTAPTAPKVRALTVNPVVALTIDTDTQPPHVLLVRGTAEIKIVDGVPSEYLKGAKKARMAEQQWQDFEARVRAMYKQMARITIMPHWAKLLDFEERIPDFIRRLVEEGA